jgi:hypothetical protein
VGGEDDRVVAVGHLVEFLHEDRALALEVFHDIAVVDDLVAHVDRLAVALERLLDDVDGPHHAGAEAARGGQDQVDWGFRGVSHGASLAAAPLSVELRSAGADRHMGPWTLSGASHRL